MEMVHVYKTSKGLFYFRNDAEKECNRAIIYESHPGEEVREEPELVWVLRHLGMYFSLNPVKIKS